jgi:hypothetical protein
LLPCRKIDAAGALTVMMVIGRRMAVHMRMMMTGRRRRQVVIGAERAVQHKRKRRHDRQGRRQTPELQTDRSKHRAPIHIASTQSLVVGFLSVQSEQYHYAVADRMP